MDEGGEWVLGKHLLQGLESLNASGSNDRPAASDRIATSNRSVISVTDPIRELMHGVSTLQLGSRKRDITMSLYRTTLLASVLVVGLGSVVGTRPAAAIDLSFLNHMNPEYTKCIRNVHSQLLPQYRNDPKINDAAVNACNNAHPMFGKG